MEKDNLIQAVADRDEGQCDQLHDGAFDSQAQRLIELIIGNRTLSVKGVDHEGNVLGYVVSEDTIAVAVPLIASALRSAVKREREECANIAENGGLPFPENSAAKIIAASIRARGEN